MSLVIDIKSANEFEKSALATADALKDIARHEEKIAKIATRLGVSHQAVSKAVTKVAATEKEREKKEAKAAAARKAQVADHKKKLADTKVAILTVSAAATAAATAAVGLGVALAKVAFDAAQSKREAGALLNAFTANRGPEAMKAIDDMAAKLGLSFVEAREQFVKFRQAGLDNRMSASLIKMRADMMALGLSAEAADKEISSVTAAGGDRYAAARALHELSRAYKGIGSGATAAAYATRSLSAAQNKVKNVVSEKLADIWERIGPGIGAAAHRLADFVTKLLNSEEGKRAIDGIVSTFNKLSAAVNAENMSTALNAILATGEAIGTVFTTTADFVRFAQESVGEAIDWIFDRFDDLVEIPDRLFKAGGAIVDGLVGGIKSRVSAVTEAVSDLAKSVYQPFAKALGIESPSKLFADYGANTVKGFELGERRELGAREMPLQEAAAKPVDTPEYARPPPRRETGEDKGGGGGIVIQNLVVQGGGNATEIARAVRHELQLLLMSGNLSRGAA